MPLQERQSAPVELLYLLIHGGMGTPREDREFGVGDLLLELAGKPRGSQCVALTKRDLSRQSPWPPELFEFLHRWDKLYGT